MTALLAAGPPAASAGLAPEWVGNLGGTLAVDGTPNEGGLSVELAALWPLDERLSLGLMGYAGDLGSTIGDLRDPNDGTYLGKTETQHRMTFGGAWRLDAVLPGPESWHPYASATWGYYRVQDDLQGQPYDAVSSTGFSLGAGLQHRISSSTALGAALRYHRLFNDLAGRYVTASVEWRWRWGAGR